MATYVEEVLADTPLAYWRLGDLTGTTADDATTNARDGTYSGNYTLAQDGPITGDGNPAVRLNNLSGGPSQVLVTNSSWLDLNGDFTYEFWIKLMTDPAGSTFPGIFRRGSGTVNGKYLFFYNSSRQMNFLRDTTTGRFGGAPLPVIPTTASNVWTHYVTTYDLASTTLKLFVNGAEHVPARNAAVTTATSTVNVDMTIGRGDNTTHGDHLIDEAAIYDVALSDARIQAHYDARLVQIPTGNQLRRWQY